MKKLNGTVIVTYRCNARCNMCNRYKKPSLPDEEISLEILLIFVERIVLIDKKAASDVFYQYHRRRTLYTDRFKGYCEGIKEKE